MTIPMTDNTMALATRPDPAPVTLFGTDDPVAVIAKVKALATPLAAEVRSRGLFKKIGDREHVYVEGWTLLGSLLGVFPITVWVRPIADADGVWAEPVDGAGGHGGWEARVEARTRSGDLVGAAESECRWSEERWSGRDSFQVRSMAQTRATSKAMRMPLGFVMELAGFAGTPAEEMDGVSGKTVAVEVPGAVCPSCGSSIIDNRAEHEAEPRKPAWKCSNRDCQGGGLRDKNQPDGKRYPWASWDTDLFDTRPWVERLANLVAARITGGDLDAARDHIDEALAILGIDADAVTTGDQANEVYHTVRTIIGTDDGSGSSY